jgi:2-dehydropantoate 2-reductase
MRWKYAKLLTNLGNSIQALCGPEAEGIDTVDALLRAEGAAALRAAGIDVATEAEEAERRKGLLSIKPVEGNPRGGGSSWQSLTRRTGTVEADYLNGEIVLLGRLHGVATPANELARHLVNRAAREGTRPGALTPDQFLALLG